MLRKEREGGSLSRQPGARSILSLIPTFATYIAKREKMHALKDYVQNGTLSNISCEASVEPNEDDRCLVVQFPTFTPHFFWVWVNCTTFQKKKTSSSTTIKNSNNGPQVRFETVISM